MRFAVWSGLFPTDRSLRAEEGEEEKKTNAERQMRGKQIKASLLFTAGGSCNLLITPVSRAGTVTSACFTVLDPQLGGGSRLLRPLYCFLLSRRSNVRHSNTRTVFGP